VEAARYCSHPLMNTRCVKGIGEEIDGQGYRHRPLPTVLLIFATFLKTLNKLLINKFPR
jgi:hypothetical protein